MIHYRYNEKKATQAAGILIKKAGGKIDYYLLTKILYIAERESLRKWNRAMFGGSLASLPHGPVHSNILDSAQYRDTTTKYWMDHIKKPHNNIIKLKNSNIDDSELSDREITLLKELYDKFKNFDFNDIKKLTHELPEYEDPGISSLSIEIDSMLKKIGKTSEEIQEIKDHSRLMNQMSQISC